MKHEPLRGEVIESSWHGPRSSSRSLLSVSTAILLVVGCAAGARASAGAIGFAAASGDSARGSCAVTLTASSLAQSDSTATVELLSIDEAYGINDAATVAGTTQVGDCGGRPVTWTRAGKRFLSVPGDCGVARAVNDHNGVAGWHMPANTDGQTGFHWRGLLLNLAPLPKSVVISDAADLNDRGEVAGTTDVDWDANTDEDPTTWPEPRARLWRDGKMIDLGDLGGGRSVARAINNHSQVVGESKTRAGSWHAFIWANGKLRDLGTLGGKTSAALDINDSGQVVGYSGTATGTTHAVMWQNGRLIDLGTLPGGRNSSAHAINQHGQAVGASDRGSWAHPFLWQNGRMTDLGLPRGYSTASATAINDRQQIVGNATRFDRGSPRGRAVLWTVLRRV